MTSVEIFKMMERDYRNTIVHALIDRVTAWEYKTADTSR
mgnify:CR=1 FL=1